ncbi:hypothetical protein [Streptomyces xanthophaeus]|uniref:hypothetical protein n=1 Tax=Streptomyces xanthophaeus TaxID=67385 RepID=UPI00371B4915
MRWGLKASHYRTPENAKSGELHDATGFTVNWRDRPADDNPEPPDLPAITGWWTHIQTTEASQPPSTDPVTT